MPVCPWRALLSGQGGAAYDEPASTCTARIRTNVLWTSSMSCRVWSYAASARLGSAAPPPARQKPDKLELIYGIGPVLAKRLP